MKSVYQCKDHYEATHIYLVLVKLNPGSLVELYNDRVILWGTDGE
jgi:hypothetical protein